MYYLTSPNLMTLAKIDYVDVVDLGPEELVLFLIRH